MKLCLDEEKHSSKPMNAGAISSRIPLKIVDLNIEQLAAVVAQPNGQTWTPAWFIPGTSGSPERNNECWGGQTVFALDFDKGISVDLVLGRCEVYEIMPAFIYSTFSSVDNNKFRVVFVHHTEITDARVRDALQVALMKIFPEADGKCGDRARYFFGGKEVIYSNYSATIDVADVIDCVRIYLEDADTSGHVLRSISRFCEAVGINMMNGLPHIEIVGETGRDWAKTGADLYTYIRSSPENAQQQVNMYFSSYVSEKACRGESPPTKYKIVKETIKRDDLIEHFDFSKLDEVCQFYRHFSTGEYWAYEPELFGLATNLLCIKGGREKFLQGIKSREEYPEPGWKYQTNYINRKLYNPQRCEGFCPFERVCDHAKNIIETAITSRGKVKILTEHQFKPLDQAEHDLKEVFQRIMKEPETKIYVIKAPAGLGKTEQYIGLKDVTIAVPTHNLKDEVAQRAKQAGNEMSITPRPPNLPEAVANEVERCYSIGAYGLANEYMQTQARLRGIPGVADYLKQLDEAKYTDRSVVTTHERLLFLQDTHDTIIIDEDIFPTLVKVEKAKLKDIIYLESYEGSLPNQVAIPEVIRLIQRAELDEVYELPCYQLVDRCELETFATEQPLSSNVLGLIKSSHFIKMLEDGQEVVYYVIKRYLPKDKKIIILSATANERISKMLLGEDIEFIDLGLVETVGKLIQYPEHSFSRYGVRRKPELIKLANRLTRGSPVITYKILKSAFPNAVAHFYALAGLDSFAGGNIAVIGTPHIAPSAYLLFANVLGIKVGKKDSKMHYVPVKRYGFEYYFYRFDNEDLREIQLHIIESELIQAVGRARILRKECVVTVLSNLPLAGAEFMYLNMQEKELLKTTISEEKAVA